MASKSLGTLTLDLLAKVSGFEEGMDKASRKSQKTAKQIEKHAAQIGAAVGAMAAGAVTGLTAMVVSTAEYAREVKNLSRLADASTQEFQKVSYAASRYGIQQEKVSDILKDTNDRIGDFIQTGGGPMLDFFENIAPKVGVTAEQFERLSGPEALQLYVSSLEAAGVSQKDMTFYMEALASDASALIPLLRDNGKEMKALGDEAERTGNVFSDMDFAELEKISRSTDEIQASFAGIRNEIVLAAIPAINDLTDMLGDQATVDAAQTLGNAIVSSLNGAIKAVKGAVEITQFLAEELAAMTNGAAADDIVRLEDELANLYSMLDNPTNRLRFFGKDGVIAYYDEDEIWQMIADTENKIVAFRNRMDSQSRAAPIVELVGLADVPAAPGSGVALPPTGGLGTPEEVDRAMIDRRNALLAAFETESQAILAAYKSQEEEIRALEQIALEEGGITQMQATQLRIENERQKNEALAELREEDLQNNDSYWQQWLESAESNLQNFDELSKTVIDNFTTGFGSAIEGLVFDAESLDDALKGVAETILRSVVNSLAQMAAQWLALQAVQMVTGTSATAATVGQAAIAGAAWAPAAAAASLATLGTNAGPAAAALVSTNALSKGLALSGMAHEGLDEIPQEGTWLLDKGERIMSSPQADKLDAFLASQRGGGGGAPIVNITENPARAGTVNTRQNSDGQWVIDVIVADALNGGRASKTYESVYGLGRQGR